MKFSIIFVCALVTASAHYLPPSYQGPQHYPVINKYGVPEDTIEVQKARSAHLAAKSYANTYSNYGQSLEESKHLRYFGPQHVPVINKFGVPEDTPEVKQAREAHLAQVNAAKSYGYTHSNYGSYQHVPVIDKHGVPEDTEEVKKARSEHLAVVAAAKSHGYSYSIPHHHQESYVKSYQGPQHYPVIDKHGVPVDTIEVQKARAQHLSYVAAAKSYAHKYSNYQSSIPATSYQIQHVQQPQYAEESYQEAQAVQVFNKESEEVRSAHLAQDAAAKSYGYEQSNYAISAPVVSGHNYFAVIGQDGLPQETVEVQNAKAQHLAEVAAAHQYLNAVGKSQLQQPSFEIQDSKDQHSGQYYQSGIEETIEVENARAKHLAHVAAEKANAHLPVIDHQGFPVETTEVQHAKAEHLLYKAELEARDENLRYIQSISQVNSQGNSQEYSQGNSQVYSQGNSQEYSQGNSQGNSQEYSQGNSQEYSQGNSQVYSQGNSQEYSQGNLQGSSQGNSQGFYEEPVAQENDYFLVIQTEESGGQKERYEGY